MRTSIATLACAALLFVASPVRAHFLWVGVAPDAEGTPSAQVWFGETAGPGEAHLIDRVAHTKAWWSAAGQPSQKLSFVEHREGDEGALIATHRPEGPGSVEAVCVYGVYQPGDSAFLLRYYAKFLEATDEQLRHFAAAKHLPLDIVPKRQHGRIMLNVTWNGKPAVADQVEVVATGPDGEEVEVDDTAKGFRFAPESAGLYAIRARLAEDIAGEHQGKAYEQQLNYCTLALLVPEESKPAASAAEVLSHARAARATWDDFPGFSADVAVVVDNQRHEGRIEVSADGDVTLTGLELDDSGIQRSLQSLVSHRLSGEREDDDVSFAEAPSRHPLGRLLRLDYDTSMGSTYRVKGHVIREVNRNTPAGRFTISVLDVHRNPEGKYLPRVYTVSSWDKDGALESSTTVRDDWVRVGSFDLPSRHAAVTTGADVHKNVEILLDGHQLLRPDGSNVTKK